MGDYWKDNNIEKPEETIVAAANRIGSVILVGARHWDSCMRVQADKMGLKGGNEEQGFINQFCEFRTREEAYKIVGENKQELRGSLEYINDVEGALFSEHLY